MIRIIVHLSFHYENLKNIFKKISCKHLELLVKCLFKVSN